MNHFVVHFDFTTVHKNGQFIGRSGEAVFDSENSIEQVNADRDEITKLCVAFVHEKKPKWNIFLMTTKDIIELKSINA